MTFNEFKPVLNYGKPHTFPTLIGEEKGRNALVLLSTQATFKQKH